MPTGEDRASRWLNRVASLKKRHRVFDLMPALNLMHREQTEAGLRREACCLPPNDHENTVHENFADTHLSMPARCR